jgi:hypothetical protein
MLKLTKQNDPDLSYPIRRFGCRFMTLLAIPQLKLGVILFPGEIQEIYDEACLLPKVIRNPGTALCGPGEDWIINEGFRRLSSDFKGIQIGEFQDDVPRRWSGLEIASYDYVIAHWKTTGIDGHFTLFDSKGFEVYDPYDPNIGDYELKKHSIQRKLIYKIY